MAFKLISATEAKPGTTILVEGTPCIIKSNEISKTGKHGHAKCRMEAIGILDKKKKVLVIPGHERMEVPHIEKRKAQIMSVKEGVANVMDLENYETLDIKIEEGLDVKEEDQVEYWKFGESKIIKRKV